MESEQQLFKACQDGRTEEVQLLLDGGIDIEVRDMHGKTPLLVAAHHGHFDTVLFLVAAGAEVNARDSSGNNAIMHCFVPEISRLLIKRGIELNLYGANHNTPIGTVAMHGDMELLREFLRAGAKIEPDDGKGMSPLQLAAQGNHASMVRYLLEQGADINYRGSVYGSTTLISAAQSASEQLVQVLLAAGALVNIQDSEDNTPLIEAAAHLNRPVIQTLLNAGADQSIPNHLGFTPLMVAASTAKIWKKEAACLDCLADLLAHGPDIDATDMWGWTALHHAARDGFTTVVSMLLAAGADSTIRNESGDAPLVCAMQRAVMDYDDERKAIRPESREADPNYEVVKLLLDRCPLDLRSYSKVRKIARERRCPEVLPLLTAAKRRANQIS